MMTIAPNYETYTIWWFYLLKSVDITSTFENVESRFLSELYFVGSILVITASRIFVLYTHQHTSSHGQCITKGSSTQR